MRRYYLKYLLYIIFIGNLIACSEMDATYKDLIKDGETKYPGRADSVQTMPGNERIKLAWWLSADPSVTSVKIFWNNKRDSLEVPVTYKGEPQKMSVIIENLTESKHNFIINTYDDAGNRSVMVEVQGEAFGPIYESSLMNRPVLDLRLVDYMGYIEWGNVQNSIGTKLIYLNKLGSENTLFIPFEENITVISDIKPGSQIQYRTMYLPDPTAIDTFYTDVESMQVPQFSELGKDKFTKVVLPTDNTTKYAAANSMESLWDNNISTFYYTGKNTGIPTWFTFDLGQTARLGKVRYNQRSTPASIQWGGSNAKQFEIWGIAETPPTDGSWNNWTKLLDVTSIKPSGLPLGQVTDEDQVVVIAGEVFTFQADSPPVRYIRIKVNSTWGNTQMFHIAELTFWGQ